MEKSKEDVIALINKILSNNFSDDEVDKLCNELYDSVEFGRFINDIIFFEDTDLNATEIYEKAQRDFNEQ